MKLPCLRSYRASLPAAVLILSMAGCEEVQLPLTPDDDPLFTTVAVNALTAQPTHESQLSAGSVVPFSLEASFQRTSADVTALPTALVEVIVWTEDADALFGRITTLSREVSQQRGTVTLTGDVAVGAISPVCGTPVRAFTDTRIETTESFPRGDRFSRRDLTFDVAGGAQSVGECVFNVVSWDTGERVMPWGTPTYVEGRNLPDENPGLHFPGTTFTLSTLRDPEPFCCDFVDFWTWVPPGAAGSGPVRAFTSQGEVSYGNDAPDQIQVPGGGDDFFEPNDEMAEAEWDFMDIHLDDIFGVDVLLFNPFLTLPDADRTIDPSRNPGGFSAWGVGDWHLIIPTLDPDAGVTTQDVCVAIFFSSSDDLDLFLYDPDGNLLSVSAQSTGDSEFVGATTSGNLFVWVAPWMAEGEMNTTFGLYQVEGADCAAFASPAQTVAGSAEKLELLDLPAGVSAPETLQRPGSLLESRDFRLPSGR